MEIVASGRGRRPVMPSDTLTGSGGMRTSRDQLRYCRRMVACTAASKVNLREMRKHSSQAASWR
eukprot:5305012-Prymnesium_polylepis.1